MTLVFSQNGFRPWCYKGKQNNIPASLEFTFLRRRHNKQIRDVSQVEISSIKKHETRK